MPHTPNPETIEDQTAQAVDFATTWFAVFDRRERKLPSVKADIEIWKDGEWLPCTWHPRTPESKAGKGYLGTARTSRIGFHAWEQNESEFTRYRISANKLDAFSEKWV